MAATTVGAKAAAPRSAVAQHRQRAAGTGTMRAAVRGVSRVSTTPTPGAALRPVRRTIVSAFDADGDSARDGTISGESPYNPEKAESPRSRIDTFSGSADEESHLVPHFSGTLQWARPSLRAGAVFFFTRG